MKYLLSAILLFFIITTKASFLSKSLGLGRVQSVAVTGKLICNEEPYNNAKVKLYDVDGLLDDFMAETHTNTTGQFFVKGDETEITDIDPKVNIYHNCNDEAIECLRKFSIIIPDDFITLRPELTKVFDIGILNLNGEMPGESRDCLN